MQTSELPSAESALPTDQSPRVINSTDATVGQPIVDRVLARKAELETALAAVETTTGHLQAEITLALSTVEALLSGDLKNVPSVVAADMNNWLERNKHVAVSAIPPAPAPAIVPDEA